MLLCSITFIQTDINTNKYIENTSKRGHIVCINSISETNDLYIRTLNSISETND